MAAKQPAQRKIQSSRTVGSAKGARGSFLKKLQTGLSSIAT